MDHFDRDLELLTHAIRKRNERTVAEIGKEGLKTSEGRAAEHVARYPIFQRVLTGQPRECRRRITNSGLAYRREEGNVKGVWEYGSEGLGLEATTPGEVGGGLTGRTERQ
jgi:hypothetical protein